MAEDYASGIVKLFQPNEEINALPYCETAEVVSPLPDLKIKLRGITYEKKQIKLDEYWVEGHTREIEILDAPLMGSDSDGDAHNSGAFPKATMIFKDELVSGDLVAVLQSKDKQTIYVLFKIARW